MAVSMLFNSVPEWITTMKSPVDFTEIDDSEIRSGLHVQGDVFALLDSYASEQTWTENKDGSRTPKVTSKVYYIIPAGSQSFVGIACDAGSTRPYNAICDATMDYLWGETEYIESEPVAFEGRLVKMEDDLYQYMVEWFKYTEYYGTTDEATIKTYVLPYMMKPFSPGLVPLLAIGGVLLLADALVIFLFIKYRKKEKAQAATAASMPAPPTQGPDALSSLRQ